MSTEEQLWSFTKALCYYAGEKEDFAKAFWKRLLTSEPILKEYQYFYEHQNFLCAYKIQNVSVVDVMVWQIDHFKARLDRESTMRTNKDRMVLMAFHTFLMMEDDPEPVLRQLKGQTGTDYPGKF